MPVVKIADVKVANRYRVNLGDLDGLSASLRNIGQLQPIVITADLRLIAGGRRLAAAQSLGWTEIDAKIASNLIDASDLLRAERDENTCRKAFTPTEEHSLYDALVALEMATQNDVVGRTSGAPSSKVRESIATIVSGNAGRYKTLEKIGEIKSIANDESRPNTVRQAATNALRELDETGNVSGSLTRVRLALKAEEARSKADISTWSVDEQMLHSKLQAGETVVVSLRENHANLVRWAAAEGKLLQVDRRTEWGNPFEMPYDGDRSTVINNYATHYLPFKPSLLSRVRELRGKALACWCAPEPCHADALIATLRRSSDT